MRNCAAICRKGRSGTLTMATAYGEHEDGAPFDGTGQGRPWPLLAGERALRAGGGAHGQGGQPAGALEGSAGLAACCRSSLDGADLTERELLHGHPSGSAMPLVWAHSDISSCCARCATARSSTCRRKASSATSRTGPYRRSGLAVHPQDPYAPRWARRCSSSVGFGDGSLEHRQMATVRDSQTARTLSHSRSRSAHGQPPRRNHAHFHFFLAGTGDW